MSGKMSSDTGTRIEKRRKEIGKTQQEIADYVKVERQTVQGWEKKGSLPRSEQALDRLADALGVTKPWILFGDYEHELNKNVAMIEANMHNRLIIPIYESNKSYGLSMINGEKDHSGLLTINRELFSLLTNIQYHGGLRIASIDNSGSDASKAGDMLIVDTAKKISQDAKYAIQLSGFDTFSIKNIQCQPGGGIKILSGAEDYPDIDCQVDDIDVIGMVIGGWAAMK